MIECQVNYVADGIVKMIKAGTRSVVLKEEVMTKYQAFVKKNMKGKVFANDQCQGWYLNSNGVNWTLWPLDLVSYWWYTRSFQMEDYNLAF